MPHRLRRARTAARTWIEDRARRRRFTRTDVSVVRVHRDDVYARVSTVGTDGERAFVLVPGIGVAANYFERLAPQLNEFGPVHALDLPGFGGVPHPRGRRMRIADYADLVGTVIDELGLDDPVVLGHSMGTQVVAELAARRPELRTIVLIGPVMNPAEKAPGVALRRFVQSSLREPPRIAVLAVFAYLLCGPRWFSRVLPEMLRYPIEDTARRIEASTLVIRGEFDRLVPREWTDRIAKALPHARAWEIPGAAHSVMHAHAEEVAALCVEHARREQPVGGDDVTVQRYPEQPRPESDEPGPAEPGRAVLGRLKEYVGQITGDDALISEGKTEHAEASRPEDGSEPVAPAAREEPSDPEDPTEGHPR